MCSAPSLALSVSDGPSTFSIVPLMRMVGAGCAVANVQDTATSAAANAMILGCILSSLKQKRTAGSPTAR